MGADKIKVSNRSSARAKLRHPAWRPPQARSGGHVYESDAGWCASVAWRICDQGQKRRCERPSQRVVFLSDCARAWRRAGSARELIGGSAKNHEG